MSTTGSAKLYMKGYIPTLDGWRAVAISMVIFYHMFFGLVDKKSTAFFAISQGAKGVDIFFALSGFLITSRMLDERDAEGAISLRAFYGRRAFRILPPYLAYLAIVSILAANGVVSLTRREIWGCLLFVRNYLPLPDINNWYTAHFWSLSVEEHFYLFWPLLLVLFGTSGSRKAAVALALGVAVWRKVDVTYHIISPYGMGRTDTRIDALLWGAFLALLVHPTEARARIATRLTPRIWVIVVLIVLATAWYEPPFGLTIQSFLVPWMILGTVLNPGFWGSRVLESSLLRWIGRLSYSLYIWQQLCISSVWPVVEFPPYISQTAANLMIGCLATITFGVVSHYVIERPLMRFGKRFLSGSKVKPFSPVTLLTENGVKSH